MIVWNLVHEIVVRGTALEEMARRFRLPVEAVQEALDYSHANREWIDQEIEEEGRRLGLR